MYNVYKDFKINRTMSYRRAGERLFSNNSKALKMRQQQHAHEQPKNMTMNNNLSRFSSIPDWDEPFTDQQLIAIEAIEAVAYKPQSTTTTTTTTITTATSSDSDAYPQIKKQKPNCSNQRAWRDRPTTVRRLPRSIFLSPCDQASLKVRYPALRFEGKIVYSITKFEVDNAALKLLQILNTRKQVTGQVAVGFDIEWRPSFKRGVPQGKAAIMQICVDANLCHVMHIFHSGIPRSLQFLLEDSTLRKAGVGIGGDTVKVYKDYNISVQAAEDISSLANLKLSEPRQWGLASLTETLIGKEVAKPKKIRLGNWEARPLSKEQLQYAATDAFASLHLYEILKSLPDPVDKTDKVLGLEDLSANIMMAEPRYH